MQNVGSHSQTHPARTPVTQKQLDAIVRAVRGRIVAGAWVKSHPWIGGQEEITQDVVVTVLETAAKGQLTPGIDPTPYLYRAALRRATLAMTKRIALLSAPPHAIASVKAVRVPVGPEIRDGGPQPDARIRAAGRARTLRQLAGQIRLHAGGMDPKRQMVVDLILGLAGDPVDLREAAWRAGITVNAAAGTIRMLTARVRTDPEARRLRQEMLANQEDT